MENETTKLVTKISNEVKWALGRFLTAEHLDALPDDELIGQYLFDERRRALNQIIEWNIGVNVAEQDIARYQANKENNDAKYQQLNKNLSEALQSKIVWEMRLKAVIEATQLNVVKTIIEQNYKGVSPSQGITELPKTE